MDKKIAIVTFYDDACKDYAVLSDKSKQAYCDKYGYKYFLHRERMSPQFDHPTWEKPKIMLSHFNDFDYIMWMDADAIISNMDFDVSELFGEKVIYMSKDVNGYNAGVFAIKVCDIGKNFLNEVDCLYYAFRRSVFREQSCMSYLMDTKYREYVCQVPIKKWNCYDNIYPHFIDNIFEKGDFILHIPAKKLHPKTNPPYRVKRFTEINEANGI